MQHQVEIRECVAVSDAPAADVKPKLCIECLQPLVNVRALAVFCSAPCRIAFNNRRAMRGAVVYDLFMAWRYQRAYIKPFKLFSLICALGKQYREEDIQLRGHGWTSWLDPEAAYAAKPWLRSKVSR